MSELIERKAYDDWREGTEIPACVTLTERMRMAFNAGAAWARPLTAERETAISQQGPRLPDARKHAVDFAHFVITDFQRTGSVGPLETLYEAFLPKPQDTEAPTAETERETLVDQWEKYSGRPLAGKHIGNVGYGDFFWLLRKLDEMAKK